MFSKVMIHYIATPRSVSNEYLFPENFLTFSLNSLNLQPDKNFSGRAGKPERGVSSRLAGGNSFIFFLHNICIFLNFQGKENEMYSEVCEGAPTVPV